MSKAIGLDSNWVLILFCTVVSLLLGPFNREIGNVCI